MFVCFLVSSPRQLFIVSIFKIEVHVVDTLRWSLRQSDQTQRWFGHVLRKDSDYISQRMLGEVGAGRQEVQRKSREDTHGCNEGEYEVEEDRCRRMLRKNLLPESNPAHKFWPSVLQIDRDTKSQITTKPDPFLDNRGVESLRRVREWVEGGRNRKVTWHRELPDGLSSMNLWDTTEPVTHHRHHFPSVSLTPQQSQQPTCTSALKNDRTLDWLSLGTWDTKWKVN